MPPLRPQRSVPKPRRYQSSSSEAEKTKTIKTKKDRRGHMIKTATPKFKKQTDSVKENIMVMKRVLKLQAAQTYKPIPLCPSNSSSTLPATQGISSCSNTSWKNAITTIGQTSTCTSTSVTNRSPTLEATSVQCSTAINSTPFSSNIASAKSLLNHESQRPSVSSLQHPTTTISAFVTSNHDNLVTSETTCRYNDLILDTTKHTASFANSPYVPSSQEPIPHQPEQITNVTASNSASSFCDPIVYAMRTSLTSNADHVDDQLTVSTHKQQFIENTQHLTESTPPEFPRPIETSTPTFYKNSNQINEGDGQDKNDINEQGNDENELDEEKEDENSNHSVNTDESLNTDQSANLSVNERNQIQDVDDIQMEDGGNNYEKLFNLLVILRTEMKAGFNKIHKEIRSRKKTVIKPDILPMKTVNNVEEFNQCDDQLYTDVVIFFTLLK